MGVYTASVLKANKHYKCVAEQHLIRCHTWILQANKAKSGHANETLAGLVGFTLHDFDKTLDKELIDRKIELKWWEVVMPSSHG